MATEEDTCLIRPAAVSLPSSAREETGEAEGVISTPFVNESRKRKVSMAEQYFAQLEAMRNISEKLNPDGGDLSAALVHQMADKLGLLLGAEQLTQALAEMDTNNDGKISPLEFEAWVKRQIMNRKRVPQQVPRAEATAGEDDLSGLRPKDAEDKAQAVLGYSTNAAAWAAFRRLDKDGSGSLDREEFQELSRELRLQLSQKEVSDAWRDMDPMQTGEMSFDNFSVLFNRIRTRERMRLLRKVESYFHRADKNGDGFLTKEEFGRALAKSKINLDPPFDLEADWEDVKKTRTGEFPDFVYKVSYREFAHWFSTRLQMDEQEIPVLPEYLVAKIEETSFVSHSSDAVKSLKRTVDSGVGGDRSAKDLWKSLTPRLMALVRLQQQWGRVHDIYHVDPHYESGELSRWIRDPDSKFSQMWDLIQVGLLLYISVVVPFRAGFEVDVPLWSTSFFIDAVIDIYFVCDLVLNFRTAYYTKGGIREDRPSAICRNYLKGWFTVDFASTLPISYIAYFTEQSPDELEGSLTGEAGVGGGARALKALRLVRLSKMLRITRIKRILTKYSDNVHMGTIISIGFTIFIIFFLVHNMACFFYLVGTGEETLNDSQRTVIGGWVHQEENWEPVVAGKDRVPGVGRRYLTSMFYVLNALEHAATNAEMLFALFAELIRDFILGLVAGLMATISMAAGDNDQEQLFKLRDMKSWMADREVPKSFRDTVLTYFNELWNNRTEIDKNQMFEDMPPTMRRTLTSFLYSKHVSNIPMFRNLGNPVISAICSVVHPIYVLRGQEVITEGSPGNEFYMLMAGELEVLKGDPDNRTRLGFLNPGAFFGESAIFAGESEVRTRTVAAVVDSDLCFLTKDEIWMLASQYPELRARLNRFATVGKKLLTKKNMSQTEFDTIKLYASQFNSMVRQVREDEQQSQAKYNLANNTVCVGQIPSVEAPHRDAMTEECLRKRFSEFGEVLTVVKQWRPSTNTQVHNSWALVVFKNLDSVHNMMNGKREAHVPAQRSDGTSGKLVRAVDSSSGVGWSHCVRRLDPEQAKNSEGSFGAAFDKCLAHVQGTTEPHPRDSGAALKTIAEDLRQQVAEIANDDSDETSDAEKWDGSATSISPMPKAYQQITNALRSNAVDTKTLQDAIAASVGDTLVPGERRKPEPEAASNSFWTFGTDPASSTPSVGAGDLDELMDMVAEMRRGQQEANARILAQGEELSRVHRLLDRMEQRF